MPELPGIVTVTVGLVADAEDDAVVAAAVVLLTTAMLVEILELMVT